MSIDSGTSAECDGLFVASSALSDATSGVRLMLADEDANGEKKSFIDFDFLGGSMILTWVHKMKAMIIFGNVAIEIKEKQNCRIKMLSVTKTQ